MTEITIIGTIFGIVGTICSIYFACHAFKRSNAEDVKKDARNIGVMQSDIMYIKDCVERVEKNIYAVDERYRNISERTAKIESSIENVIKRVNELCITKGG